MTQPWKSTGFPPLADRPFDIDLDEASFAFVGEALDRFGDLVGVAPATRAAGMVLVNRPSEAWHVLGSNYRNYRKGVGARKVRMLLGRGLIANEGDAWRDRRRVLQPSFHPEAISAFMAAMTDVNRRMVERWHEKAQGGEAIDVSTDTARLTLEIVVRSIFGDDLEEMVAAEGDIPFAMLADDLERTLTTVHRLQRQRDRVRELIAQRRASGEERHDLLGVLLAARDAETREPIDDKSVTDEVVTMAVAGHETSASALSWAWYLLSQHPEVEADLHREVDALAAAPTSMADLNALPRTRRVLDETLRLYPPGWLLTRRAIAEDTLGPYRIPAGTDVLVSPYYLHRRQDLWQSPEAFDPDRFTRKLPHKHAYIPFGAGPRRCIGDNFALVEMLVHVATVARGLRLRYLGDGPPEIEAKVNLRPKERLKFRGELR